MTDTRAGNSSHTDLAPMAGPTSEASVVNTSDNTDYLTEHKLTSAQIEANCPVALQELGDRIAACLEKARKCEDKAKQYHTTIAQHLAKAKEACDTGGFETFREMFCPLLGKSQAYALLAIAAEKKTLAEHRTEERLRKQKSRASQKGAAANSGTVPESVDPKREPRAAHTEDSTAEVTSPGTTEENQEPNPATSARGAPSVGDPGLKKFTDHTLQLVQMIRGKAQPSRYIKTAVQTNDLAKLGRLLSDIADLKSKASFAPPEMVELSAEQSGEARKAENAAHEANDTYHEDPPN